MRARIRAESLSLDAQIRVANNISQLDSKINIYVLIVFSIFSIFY